MARHVAVRIEETLSFHSSLRLVQRRPGFVSGSRKRPVREIVTGEEQSADGTWVEKTRVIDREQGTYVERVEDADGQMQHVGDELLSDHTGHGSDKATEM